MQQIDYEGMSQYFNKSERTLQRWKTEKPDLFQLMIDEYNHNQGVATLNKTGSTVISVLSLKGGVGKSMIADHFAYWLGSSKHNPSQCEAVVLNLDFGQSAAKMNASHTIEYVEYMNTHTVGQLIEELKNKYRFIIVDTPGDPTEEVWDAMRYTSKIIIPMTIGGRTDDATISGLNAYFGEGSEIKGEFDVFFFFNAYTDRKKRDEAALHFKKSYNDFKMAQSITFTPKLGSLDYSNAISTGEYAGKSVFELHEENKTAYAVAAGKISALCSQIENHFNL